MKSVKQKLRLKTCQFCKDTGKNWIMGHKVCDNHYNLIYRAQKYSINRKRGFTTDQRNEVQTIMKKIEVNNGRL